MSKELLVNQMKVLKATMELSIVESQVANANGYMGWLKNKLSLCATIMGVTPDKLLRGQFEFVVATSLVTDDLDRACNEFFEDDYLSKSIWGRCSLTRMCDAIYSDIFTWEELDTLSHLNTESTPQGVVDYLTVCIAKVEAFS